MNYNIFSISTTIIILIMMIYSLFNKNIFKLNISKKSYYITIGILFLISLSASLYEFGNLPYGYHVDEAGMAYDAWSIANYGVDRYLYNYPVYFINFGGGQNALYGYIAAIFIKLFGLSIYTIRIPAILFRISTFICLFTLLKKHKVLSIYILLLFSVAPFFVLSSRWALESYLMYGMITLAVTFMIKALNSQKIRFFIISSILFGLSLYTYAISYITIPLILCMILLYALYNKLISLKHIVIVASIIFIIALPLLLVLAVNNGLISEIKSFISIPQFHEYRGSEVRIGLINDNLYMLKSLFTIDNQAIHGTSLIYNGFEPYYTLYLISIPLCILGFILTVIKVIKCKFKDCLIDYTFLVWSLSSLFSILIVADPNINKANAIYIPLIYFIAIALVYLTTKVKYFIYFISVVYLINFTSFYNFYVNEYSELNEFSYLFSTSYDEAFKFSTTLDTDTIYSDSLTAEAYIYPHLYYEISPYEFNKQEVVVDEINKTFIYYMPEEFDFDAAYITHVTYAENFDLEIPINKTMHYEVFLDKAVIWFE